MLLLHCIARCSPCHYGGLAMGFCSPLMVSALCLGSPFESPVFFIQWCLFGCLLLGNKVWSLLFLKKEHVEWVMVHKQVHIFCRRRNYHNTKDIHTVKNDGWEKWWWTNGKNDCPNVSHTISDHDHFPQTTSHNSIYKMWVRKKHFKNWVRKFWSII